MKNKTKSGLARAALMAGAAIVGLSAQAQAQIETVTVTAEKRSEPLQDVPIAVTAISSQMLERSNINGVSELQQLSPSITFSDSANSRGQGLNIRGVGTQNFSDGVEPSVSTVVDGVVLGRQAMSVFDLVDIDHVEVLNGPQGTLFGKNSSAGVLNIVTKKPTADPEFMAGVSYGSLNEVKLKASANGAISDDVDARVSGYFTRRDGTGTNLYDNGDVNNDKQWALRGKVLYTPMERLQILVTGDYENIDNTCCQEVPRSASPGYAALIAPVIASPKNFNGNYDGATFLQQHSGGASVQADYDLGGSSITSITAYRAFHDYDNNDDGDITPLPIISLNNGIQDQSQFTQELRWQSTDDGPLQYTVGAYFFDQWLNAHTRQTATGVVPALGAALCATAPCSSDVVRSIDTTSVSLFGQGTYRVTDFFRIIGGLRWTTENLDAAFARFNSPGYGAGFQFQQPLARTPIKADDSNVSYKVGAQFDVMQDVMAYFTVTSGFKGAAINLLNNISAAQIANGEAALAPETSTAYEAGLRTQFWDKRAVVNLTGFWTKYENFQAQSFDATQLLFTLSNAGALRTRGIEADIDVQPLAGLTLSGNAAYTEATFLDFTSNCYPGQTAAQGCMPAIPAAPGHPATPARQSLAGATLANAPKFSFTLNADYDFPIDQIDKVGYIHVSYHHTSDVQYNSNQDPNSIQKAYGLVNASIGLEPEDGSYNISLFAKNLFDQHYASFIAANGLFAGSYAQLMPEDARRILGVSATVNF
ncbi:MAG TPA: TonB-dependent receptor [Rhizomicrobium sp.]|jgi:iron complex outermembrane receptor protein